MMRVTFAATAWSAAGSSPAQQVSLTHGWVPVTVQVLAAAMLLVAVGWRTRRWRLLWWPVALLTGGVVAALVHWYVDAQGLADDAAPVQLWIWTGIVGAALVLAVAGWRGARWWRRGVAVAAVPASALCAVLALNLWVGYSPTVDTAWNQVTAGALPDQTDPSTVAALRSSRAIPTAGTVVNVDIPSAASGFTHRKEFVYLPPAWYASDPPPRLPALMMIGGEFNTPTDWVRAGNAIRTADAFAAGHGGNAPVLVFVDSGGKFNNDTECVNGSRGNAADHLTKDVVPYLVSSYGVSADRANWGVVGWSMGGTCAVDLTTMHPEEFSVFEDIAGDSAPNAGTRSQTITRLFGGDATRYAQWDPASVIARHGPYQGVSAWFDVNGTAPAVPAAAARTSDQAAAATSLCALGSANGIRCSVVWQPGKHDWPFADRAFAAALPWLAGAVGTPGVPPSPLPPR